MEVKKIICLSFVFLLFGCGIPPSQLQIEMANYGSYPNDYKKIITSHMKNVLKDPGSAQYDYWGEPQNHWISFAWKNFFGYGVCVDINAKNSYGGYVGFKTYYFFIRDDRVILGNESSTCPIERSSPTQTSIHENIIVPSIPEFDANEWELDYKKSGNNQ